MNNTAEKKQPIGPLRNGVVDPSRLLSGRWCHHRNRTVGEGDISAAYSGDLIALQGRVRKPFRLNGWDCIAISKGNLTATAYRLVPIEYFEDTPTTYREKRFTNGGDEARRDPLGFYHGMTVKRGGKEFVLAGPKIEVVAGELEPGQGELF